MKKVVLSIEGMTCAACSSGLEKYLNRQEGVLNATVNLVLAQAFIEYDETLTVQQLETFIEEAGFKSLGIYHEEKEKKQDGIRPLVVFGILAFLTFYISMASMIGFPIPSFLDRMHAPVAYSSVLFLLSLPFLFYGKKIWQSGIKHLFHKNPNMDTLVTLGVFSSFAYSIFNFLFVLFDSNKMGYVHHLYFESCVMITYFIQLGRFIDRKSKEKTKEALKELVQITPTKAFLKKGKEIVEVSIDEVQKKDILVCYPGMKIAVDGVIISGSTHLDEAFITGESLPVKKSKNDKVIAGSMNIDGYIEYQALKIGKDSTISEIVRLVVEATNTKAPIQRLADRVSSYFVPAILLIAFMTFLFSLLLGSSMSSSLVTFVTILVVACPCALGLATPLAIVVSEGLCAKNGILVKKSETLENANKIETVIFDKTGTLTYGNLKIAKLLNYGDFQDEELLRQVASLEAKTTHPIASAFNTYIEEHQLPLEKVTHFKVEEGIGLSGQIKNREIYVGNHKLFPMLEMENTYEKEEKKLQKEGNSIVYVIVNKKVEALIGVKDIVRSSAKKTVLELKKLGKKVIMLTGDNENTANRIAKDIEIDTVIANVMPKDKAKVVKDFIAQGNLVMMVGDGINDAPSLATATIGVSIHGGTDIAADSSDVLLMHDDLEKIIFLIKVSQKTIRTIRQNLFWAFFYNICMIPIAMGLLKPWGIVMSPMFAALAMTLSSLTVVFNTLRLRK